MATRRQERVARVIRDTVSDAILRHLSDPCIEAFVSVTRVEVAGDLRSAEVFLSMFGKDASSQKRTFAAITRARPRIQALLGDRLDSKFCPVLRFSVDEKFKKMLETINLIDQVTNEPDRSDAGDAQAEQ